MENDKFVCKDLLLASYFMAKGHPYPEFGEREGRVVFLFDKTHDLMNDFHIMKNDEFFKTIKDNFHDLKRAMHGFRQG